MEHTYIITGATLYFENGKRQNLHFTATTTDLERFRSVIKEKHEAKVVRLLYENPI